MEKTIKKNNSLNMQTSHNSYQNIPIQCDLQNKR